MQFSLGAGLGCACIHTHRVQSALIICTLTFQSLIGDLVYIAMQIMAANKMDTGGVFFFFPIAQLCGVRFMSDCIVCIFCRAFVLKETICSEVNREDNETIKANRRNCRI